MKRLNSRGFTLIELIATVIILALLLSIGGYSVIQIMKNAKENDYKLLIENINSAAELYYQECKYSNNSGISCNVSNGIYTIDLGGLVEYGYLKGNTSDGNDNDLGIVNPMDNKDISSCQISVKYNTNNAKVEVSAVGATGSCPTAY